MTQIWENATNACAPGGYGSMLYQWPVVMDWDGTGEPPEEGSQGLCPNKWHVPTDDEWKILEMNLGMSQAEADETNMRGINEGDKLKDIEADWCDNPTDCGVSGFNVLPAGYRDLGGSFYIVGSYGSWWTSSPSDSSVWYRSLFSSNSVVYRGAGSQSFGRSVRCLLGQEPPSP